MAYLKSQIKGSGPVPYCRNSMGAHFDCGRGDVLLLVRRYLRALATDPIAPRALTSIHAEVNLECFVEQAFSKPATVATLKCHGASGGK